MSNPIINALKNKVGIQKGNTIGDAEDGSYYVEALSDIPRETALEVIKLYQLYLSEVWVERGHIDEKANYIPGVGLLYVNEEDKLEFVHDTSDEGSKSRKETLKFIALCNAI